MSMPLYQLSCVQRCGTPMGALCIVVSVIKENKYTNKKYLSAKLDMAGLHWADALAFLNNAIDIGHFLEVGKSRESSYATNRVDFSLRFFLDLWMRCQEHNIGLHSGCSRLGTCLHHST